MVPTEGRHFTGEVLFPIRTWRSRVQEHVDATQFYWRNAPLVPGIMISSALVSPRSPPTQVSDKLRLTFIGVMSQCSEFCSKNDSYKMPVDEEPKELQVNSNCAQLPNFQYAPQVTDYIYQEVVCLKRCHQQHIEASNLQCYIAQNKYIRTYDQTKACCHKNIKDFLMDQSIQFIE